MIDGLILAGGRPVPAWDEQAPSKSFVRIAGKPMLSYIIDACQACSQLQRLVAVVPPAKQEWLLKTHGLSSIADQGSIIDNLSAGIRFLQPQAFVLVITGDIPLITPEAINDFIDRCHPYDADFYYPVVTRQRSEQQYPGVKRTFVPLRGGTFTGGNLFLLRAARVAEMVPQFRKLIAFRKQPYKLARLLGWPLILRLIFRRLTIGELEDHVSALFAVTARAVITDYAAVGADVDKDADLELVNAILSR